MLTEVAEDKNMYILKYLICFLIVVQSFAYGAHNNKYVESAAWEKVDNYLMPRSHPIRAKLDKFFKKARITQDVDSLKAAGFDNPHIRSWTKLVVTRHPRFPGYVFKIYTDSEPYYKGVPEYYQWIKRVKGANMIRKYIAANNVQGYFKVPKKWIYVLPEKPAPAKGLLRKNFIVVEEDMQIWGKSENEKMWGSPAVTKDMLTAFHRLIKKLGLWDNSKPANAPFSKDGKIAFIDTEEFGRPQINWYRLTPHLSPEMQTFWHKLTGQ